MKNIKKLFKIILAEEFSYDLSMYDDEGKYKLETVVDRLLETLSNNNQICTACSGSGRYCGKTCGACNGTGYETEV